MKFSLALDGDSNLSNMANTKHWKYGMKVRLTNIITWFCSEIKLGEIEAQIDFRTIYIF